MSGISGDEDLKTLTTEIEKSHDQVIATTSYIKAQSYLLKKCKQSDAQNKETYSSIFTANLKLQSEITQARREITSLLIASETIKNGNVELKKEYLLAKEKTLEVRKRIEDGEKKYENLWLESKARYESLPFVQKLQKCKEEVKNIKHQINELENTKRSIIEDMKTKKESCREMDRKRIIALAEFMVIERPKYIKMIKEKSAAIKKAEEESEAISPKKTDDVRNPDDNGDLKVDTKSTSLLPTLQLHYIDFDGLNTNQNKIKSNDNFINTSVQSYSVHSMMEIDPSKISRMEPPNTDEFISSYFYKPISTNSVNKTSNHVKNKLISLINDIKISENKARKMIADVDPAVLQPVDTISAKKHQNAETNNELQNTKDNDNPEQMDTEEVDLAACGSMEMIMPPTQFLDLTSDSQDNDNPEQMYTEEVDLAACGSKEMIMPPTQFLELTSDSQDNENPEQMDTAEVDLAACGSKEMIMPPTQFLELTSDSQVSQNEQRAEELDQESTSIEKEEPYKKKAKLDLLNNDINAENRANECDTLANENNDSQDEGFAKIKDMLLKKYNLDLSPQFAYQKKNMISPLNKQRLEDTVVTSKFFLQEQNQNTENTEIETEVVENIPMVNNQAMTTKQVVPTAEEIHEESANVTEQDKHRMEDAPSAKVQKVKKSTTADKPFSGFALTEGTQSTSDFLDESTNNSTFGDDFISCLDTSFLSPKANLTTPNIERSEVLSQDMPNLLAGLRKTGLSFFKSLSPESKPDSSGQNEKQSTSGFSFNFGGEEKKTRGGLFSMFQ